MTRSPCDHSTLSFVSSAYATTVDYRRPTGQQRAAATTVQGSLRLRDDPKTEINTDDLQIANLSLFPAPLVLPGDDLSLDPRYPPQSLRAWMRLKDRNQVTQAKSIIYVAAPPGVDSDVRLMHDWSCPLMKNGNCEEIGPPEMEAIIDYLEAFYNGMSVKPLPYQLSFVAWDAPPSKGSRSKSQKSLLRYVGLTTSTECVRIRTRPLADKVFAHQLNLDDLLDAAISMLPEDAYALLMLVDQDLYESEDDEFVCGRAYGGSRVAVVSKARYNPILDSMHNVDREHTWPTSHCASYMHECCAASLSQLPVPPPNNQRQRKSRNTTDVNQDQDHSLSSNAIVVLEGYSEQVAPPPAAAGALQAAVSAHTALPSLDASPSTTAQTGLWLSRICRTTSHELGHCFGIDHCVYYACAMQGSSSLSEDGRQPPYLCPIDLAKLLKATGQRSPEEHYIALLRFCEKYDGVHLFDAFAVWIRWRLKDMEGMVVGDDRDH